MRSYKLYYIETEAGGTRLDSKEIAENLYADLIRMFPENKIQLVEKWIDEEGDLEEYYVLKSQEKK